MGGFDGPPFFMSLGCCLSAADVVANVRKRRDTHLQPSIDP